MLKNKSFLFVDKVEYPKTRINLLAISRLQREYVAIPYKEALIMNDASMRQEMESFIDQRLNDHGRKESLSVQNAWSDFNIKRDALEGTLSHEQRKLLTACENALMVVDGETRDYFYRAGFSDAVFFLLKWKETK